MNQKSTRTKFQRLSDLLSRESQLINIKKLQTYYDIIQFCLILFFTISMIANILNDKIVDASLDSLGLLFSFLIKFFKNKKQRLFFLILTLFWYQTIQLAVYTLILNTSFMQQIRNIWKYISCVECLTPLLSLKYQIIHKIIFHFFNAQLQIQEYDNQTTQNLEFILQIFLVLINISFTVFKIQHTEKEYEKKLFYEDILFKLPGCCYKLIKNSQDQICFQKSNLNQSYKEFVDYYTKKNLLYKNDLPYQSGSFIDLLFKLINDENNESQEYKITAFSNKGKPNQQKFKILIMKQQENNRNVIFIRISEPESVEQMEQMKIKELMLNTLNHDVKNPLIAGSLLIQQIISEFHEGIQIKFHNLDTLSDYFNISLSLINGYFDFTQIQLGKLKIQPENFLLYEPILQTIKIMLPSANKKLINLKSLFDIKKIFCKNDVRRIQQVLMNLINNAIKFTQNSGEVIVKVEEFIYHNLVYISVTDSGIGMNQDQLSKIGQPYIFFNPYNMNSQGTGIGLYTSQETVGQIGPIEKIFIKSTELIGSEFSFLMYLNADDDTIKSKILRFDQDIKQILLYLRQDEIIVDQSENQIEICVAEEKTIRNYIKKSSSNSTWDNIISSPFKKKKKTVIMVVDDEEFIRQATINAIKKLGVEKFEFYEAENGVKGVDLFKKLNKTQISSTIDIIFTDIQMPELDGYQMVNEINQLIEDQNFIKPYMIALSSNQSIDYDKKCQILKINQNLTKPQNAEQIRDIIRYYKQKKKLNSNFKSEKNINIKPI